ncbi:MAG TPA: serine hydrolase [Candidatus Rubrimentiphilum sp.]|nr:serine hydrolase [Candidatus Rubrimentiphilum sp.]
MQEAVAYHERHKPQALVISRDGAIEVETYGGDFTAGRPHALYSGTKSFWGPLALVAQREGLLQLNETAGATFPSWRDDPVKRPVTIHQLLTLTAGIGFGGLGNAVPPYEKALAVQLKDRPGSRFTYGGIPLQVFGAILSEKLKSSKMTPHEYLRAKVLEPAGVTVDSWRKLADGTRPLPTGAFLTARNWLAYGEYVLAHRADFAECFKGTPANPRYGLCWWLAPPGAPPDTVYASGSGGQALYVVPSAQLVAARFGGGGSFKHEAFLKRLA